MIKVFLIDDDATLREGLRQFLDLTEDIRVIGEAASIEEALEACRLERPDVVLLDADLPRSVCSQTMAELSCCQSPNNPQTAVICLAVYPDQHEAAIEAGAVRYLRKDGSPRELVATVREVAQAQG